MRPAHSATRMTAGDEKHSNTPWTPGISGPFAVSMALKGPTMNLRHLPALL